MRATPLEAEAFIKGFESFSNVVYTDIVGKPTIGYGHLIREGESFPHPISHAEGLALLHKDLQKAENAVLRLIQVPLTDGQYGALVSFTFNLGSGALQRSTMRQKLNRADMLGAAAEFPKWIYAGSKKSRGLLRRRMAEQAMFLKQSVVVSLLPVKESIKLFDYLPWLEKGVPVKVL
jgi:lysozyme